MSALNELSLLFLVFCVHINKQVFFTKPDFKFLVRHPHATISISITKTKKKLMISVIQTKNYNKFPLSKKNPNSIEA